MWLVWTGAGSYGLSGDRLGRRTVTPVLLALGAALAAAVPGTIALIRTSKALLGVGVGAALGAIVFSTGCAALLGIPLSCLLLMALNLIAHAGLRVLPPAADQPIQ